MIANATAPWSEGLLGCISFFVEENRHCEGLAAREEQRKDVSGGSELKGSNVDKQRDFFSLSLSPQDYLIVCLFPCQAYT